jgi:hypothetical protein
MDPCSICTLDSAMPWDGSKPVCRTCQNMLKVCEFCEETFVMDKWVPRGLSLCPKCRQAWDNRECRSCGTKLKVKNDTEYGLTEGRCDSCRDTVLAS